MAYSDPWEIDQRKQGVVFVAMNLPVIRLDVSPIPEGAMRVAPGSDAVVWKVSPEYSGEL